MEQVNKTAQVLKSAASYGSDLVMASTDATTRGLRAGQGRFRTLVTRYLCQPKGGKQGKEQGTKSKISIDGMCLAQPYVPSSLFGGRLPQAIAAAQQKLTLTQDISRSVTQLTGGSLREYDVPVGQLPFRGGGPQRGSTRKWKGKPKKGKGKGFSQHGGGNTNAPSNQQQNQNQGWFNQNHSTQAPSRGGARGRGRGRGRGGRGGRGNAQSGRGANNTKGRGK